MLCFVILVVLVVLLVLFVIVQDNVDDLRFVVEVGDSFVVFNYGYVMIFFENGDFDFIIGCYWFVQVVNDGLVEVNYVLGLIYCDGIGMDVEFDWVCVFFEFVWQVCNISVGIDLVDLLVYDYEGEVEVGLVIYCQLFGCNDVGVFVQL